MTTLRIYPQDNLALEENMANGKYIAFAMLGCLYSAPIGVNLVVFQI